MANRLDGKIAVVTASTRGIGRAIADRYADEGAKVYFAVRNAKKGKKAVEAVLARGGQADMVYFEATDPDSIYKMIDEVVEKEGRIDILVNNYGGSNPMVDLDIVNGSWDVFSSTVQTNLQTVFIACQSVLKKAMIAQGSGSIINIGSVAGHVPDLTQCGYGVAKAGIAHLTKQIALQTGKYNVRCNALLPGITATGAVKKYLPAELQAQYLGGCPIHRLAEPEEMASLAVYLGSDESQYTTGQSIKVAGGFDFCTPIYAISDK